MLEPAARGNAQRVSGSSIAPQGGSIYLQTFSVFKQQPIKITQQELTIIFKQQPIKITQQELTIIIPAAFFLLRNRRVGFGLLVAGLDGRRPFRSRARLVLAGRPGPRPASRTRSEKHVNDDGVNLSKRQTP